MEKKDLTLPPELCTDGFPDHLFIEFEDIGFYRLTVLRGGVDDGKVADPDQRQVEGPWNRRRGECQDIHECAELLEFFLVGHPETLFLINNHQPQIFEIKILLKKPVGTDYNIYSPLTDAFQDFLLFGLRFKTVQDIHTHGVILKPQGESPVVLFGQNGCGHQHRHLLAIHDRPERGPERHFRFAEPGIPADQPVHGFGVVHVQMNILNSPGLVGCFLKLKGGGELIIQVIRRGKSISFHNLPGGIDGHQFFRHFPNGFFDLLFDDFPGKPSQFINLRHIPVRSDVALDLIETVNGNIEFIAVQILQ